MRSRSGDLPGSRRTLTRSRRGLASLLGVAGCTKRTKPTAPQNALPLPPNHHGRVTLRCLSCPNGQPSASHLSNGHSQGSFQPVALDDNAHESFGACVCLVHFATVPEDG